MIEFHRSMALKATDKTLVGKHGMQADQLEKELTINTEFMRWVEGE